MRNTRKKRRPSSVSVSKQSWMAPVTHGYHVVADQSCSSIWEEESENDSVVVQREQIEGVELWFFGVFDPKIGDKVIKFMQTHFFNMNFKEVYLNIPSFFFLLSVCWRVGFWTSNLPLHELCS